MTQRQFVTIGDDQSRCVLCPDLGGSIVGWVVDGQQMLRSSDSSAVASSSPLMLASFPLVPYSNRIAYAKFNWGGQDFQTTPNLPPEPHAMHGIGWTMPWHIDFIDTHSCILGIEHVANEYWPFAFTASQRFELINGALKITATATSLEGQPAPLAFGHHPYFDCEGASLRFTANALLMNEADGLPLAAVIPDRHYDFSESGIVAGRNIDNCYTGWDGCAQISWEGRKLALDISTDMTAAILYIPAGEQYFCFEPVPHVSNALNRPDLSPAMPEIQPGASFVSTLTLKAVG